MTPKTKTAFITLLVLTGSALSQTAPKVKLRIGNQQPSTITAADLAKLPRHTAKVTAHGKEATFEGVLLHDVLTRAGVQTGHAAHRKTLTTYVLTSARDGYEVLFGLGELDPEFQDSEILIADRRDGKPLSETEGPFQIVVPHDKEPARSLRMLDRIDVVQVTR